MASGKRRSGGRRRKEQDNRTEQERADQGVGELDVVVDGLTGQFRRGRQGQAGGC